MPQAVAQACRLERLSRGYRAQHLVRQAYIGIPKRAFYVTQTKGRAMKIPEHLRIPVIVFALQAALLAGTSLIFLVLRPSGA
jgi:hypothetical protein